MSQAAPGHDLDASPRRILPIERINIWMGAFASWTLLAMTLIVGFEVASRYLFNAPTTWAWDVNTQLMLLLLMLGMAEVYRQDAHVRVDILITNLSPRQRTVIDILFAPVFLFTVFILTWSSWDYFIDSYELREAASTLFAPPLYPIKFTMVIAGVLLLMQGIVKLWRDVSLLLHPTPAGDATP